jgi:hypothetical protein
LLSRRLLGKGRLMQSAAKRSDGSNVYKLSDHANSDQDASFDHTDDNTKKPTAAGLSYKEPLGSGSSPEAPDAGKSAAGESAAAAPSSPDDALAWLRIIQNATADLTADIRGSKGDGSARSFADEEAPFGRNPPPSPPSFAGPSRRKPSLSDTRLDDYGDERELAQRLSYRTAEAWQVPSQTLRAAAMPYVAATAVFAFLAGSAAVYFLMGSSSPDVKARAAAPAAETQIEAPLARAEQPSSKKSGLQRTTSPAVSADSTAFPGSKSDEQGAKPAEPAAPAQTQPQAWSDTVQTFKQFVRPEQK